jgi:hypothetical protein
VGSYADWIGLMVSIVLLIEVSILIYIHTNDGLPTRRYIVDKTDLSSFPTDGYNVKGLKGQIMTYQESRKTKNILDITFLIL